MAAGDYAECKAEGICTSCRSATAERGVRCDACRAKRLKPGAAKRACSYCKKTGHYKATCPAWATDQQRMKQIDANVLALKAACTPDILLEWERRAKERDALLAEITRLRKELGR
jgi:hypothetical protein